MLFALECLLQVGENGNAAEQLPNERFEHWRCGQFVSGPGEAAGRQIFSCRILRWPRQLWHEQRSLTKFLLLESRDDVGRSLLIL